MASTGWPVTFQFDSKGAILRNTDIKKEGLVFVLVTF